MRATLTTSRRYKLALFSNITSISTQLFLSQDNAIGHQLKRKIEEDVVNTSKARYQLHNLPFGFAHTHTRAADGNESSSSEEDNSPNISISLIHTLADTQIKWTELLTEMDYFIDTHISTASSLAKEDACRHIQPKVFRADFLFSLCGIIPAAPLEDAAWLDISKTFSSACEHSASNYDVHSAVQTIIRKAMAMSNSPTCVEFESVHCKEEKLIVKKPDGTLYVTDDSSRAITALLVPIVLKPPKRLSDAIDQALGFLVSRLKAQLELVEPLTAELCGYCLGLDGSKVVLGFAAVRNMKFGVYTSDITGMPLWPFSEKPHPT